MKLEKLARDIADEPLGDRNYRMSGLWPVDAVIQCAREASAIDQDQFDHLIAMNWSEDFSAYVGPWDTLVHDALSMAEVPRGCFLAFIEVDQPQSHETVGRRHLIHAMISLGDGLAVGCRNSQIGLPTETDAWEVIDLVEHLNWLPPNLTNHYDVINGMPTAIAKSRVLRIRYRAPDSAPRQDTTPFTDQGVWGSPQPSGALADRIVAAAVLSFQGFKIQSSHENWISRRHDPIYRPTFSFRVDRDDYEMFFNSPNELRGHYYAGAEIGDRYTRELLDSIFEAVESEGLFPSKVQHFDDPSLALRNSIHRGKIWTTETDGLIVSSHWSISDSTDRHAITIPPNNRWHADKTQNQGNLAAFFAEIESSQDPLLVHLTGDARGELREKLTTSEDPDDPTAADAGSKYLYTSAFPVELEEGRKRLSQQDVDSLPNIDVKGGWIRPDGSDGDFVPNEKLFRGHQIKWFGFT